MRRFLLILMVFAIVAVFATGCNKDAGSKPTEELDPDAAVTIKGGLWAKDGVAAGLQGGENYKNLWPRVIPILHWCPNLIHTLPIHLSRWR